MSTKRYSEPIAAIATAAGRGGIGVVRVSGPDLAPVIDAVCGRTLQPRHATLVPFRDAAGEAIDTGIALHFPAPHSYTGEDVLELHGHGGPVVMQLLLGRVLEAGRNIGVRLAEPGEFTRRAFENDKLDLAQAEAVADLIDASTTQAARSASRSMAGAFSAQVHQIVDALVKLRMLVEATLDFPEEEIDFLQQSDAAGQLARLRGALARLLDQARQGALLRDGLDVVLVGEPNVGKSSLLNALAGAEVAIVTAVPGTTRDRIAQAIQVEGVPLNVIDTAGLRATRDEVERIGIERTLAEIARADVVLHLIDAGSAAPAALAPAGATGDEAFDDARFAGDSAAQTPGGAALEIEQQIAARLPAGVPTVRVFNKIDLTGDAARTDGTNAVWLSAKTGEGIGELRRVLLELAGWHGTGESLFTARERHLVALRAASAHLAAADAHAQQQAMALDLFAEELRLAQEQLNSITGEFGADDLLGLIFSRFCIGK
ncbi:MAG TPA: tRNA uridine-5-carboxymethylaminomethyl(34) synthesis GTPase MnmE [Burkholderiaceae bacterium]|nr:tRNA uridine-5-carboxymethylaminomethyl(34) synthesis GTPase MnmE [Burkholderiaceae bacterium]